MRDFKELEVWNESHEIALEIYRITKAFPKEEVYSITSQLEEVHLKKRLNAFIQKLKPK